MKVAVFGTGSIGMRHLQVMREVENVELIAIPKRRERIGLLKVERFDTARDLQDAARKGATHCIIATDTGQHVSDSLQAVEAGLDMLVEKPLSVNATEAARLTRRVRHLGRRVFVGSVLRFSESLNTFRSLVKEVGPLHSVRIECQSYLPDWRPQRPYKQSYSARAGEGGVLLDLVHEIDYAGWLFGWPAAAQARVRNLGKLGIAADEIAELNWETLEGCFVSISLDYLSRPDRRRMRACGELGTIEWDGVAGTVNLALAGKPATEVRSHQARNEMFLAQDCAFVNATFKDCDPRLATGEDGVKTLAVCDAARRASESRREETVEYP